MAQKSDYPTEGDIVKWMVDRKYCTKTVTLKAATTDEIYPGMVLIDDTGYIACAAANEATATAIALERISATGGEKCLVLWRGPALVDQPMIDYVQDTYADADTNFDSCAAIIAKLIVAYDTDGSFVSQVY